MAGIRAFPALLFAGVIIEGAVIAYESNLRSGGAGARYLGVGVSAEYRTDRVSVALRLISTKTGEVLITTETSATIYSYQVSGDIFRFIEQNENLLEAETGMAANESPNIAVRRAVELGVIDIVKKASIDLSGPQGPKILVQRTRTRDEYIRTEIETFGKT